MTAALGQMSGRGIIRCFAIHSKGSREATRKLMAFTVTRPGGTLDRGFAAYSCLLEKRTVDLTRTPRTPEPGTESRRLHVWRDREALGPLAFKVLQLHRPRTPA